MTRLIFIVLLVGFSHSIFAEGTKELRPSSVDSGSVEINDGSRPFALESNTDSLHRLFIHINNTSEKIYFGFNPADKTAGHGTFRIKDPSGTVVYAQTNIPTASGAGYIDTYSQAVAGPMIGGSPAGGYNPLSYTPTTTGDYYIEFTTTLAGTYYFNLFDITVVNATNSPIPGRLWSYAWDLSTRGGVGKKFNGTMYVYSTDKYTTSIFFNGMEPYGFVVSCNSKGTQNTGNASVDRQSVEGNHTYPEYKVFLNQPDATVYGAPVTPTMIQDLSVIGSPLTGSPVKFYLNMNKSGTVEIFLDLDGVAGYQSGNKDVAVVKTIKAGGDTIIWNGKDNKGVFVTQNVSVSVTSRFATGVTHFPIYDAEYHTNGYIVNRITPSASRAAVYWDDSQLASGTTNFIGASGNTDGHNWTANYGDVRTMNTWWNGFENDNLKSFTFTMDGTFLPITLVDFECLKHESAVAISWRTASEMNNASFEIERSKNGLQWETIETIEGAGNSTKSIQYTYTDQKPLNGTSYYRLKQTDVDGKSSYSKTLTIQFSNTVTQTDSNLKSYPNPAISSITIEIGTIIQNKLEIFTTLGLKITDKIPVTKINDTTYSVDISTLENGCYILKVNDDSVLFMKQ